MSKEDNDIYYQLQEEMDQKKDVPETEAEIEAENIEHKNYTEAKKIRTKLQGASAKFKKATDKLKKQGEKISNCKKKSYDVQKKAGKAEDLAEEIDRESKCFPCFGFSCWSFCGGGLFSSKKKSESDMANITTVKDKQPQIEETESEEKYEISSDSKDEEYLKGQHKTDKELKRMLKIIRNIKKESAVQSSLTKLQKNDLTEVQRINELTKSKVKSTNEFLDDDNKALRK